MGSDDPPGHDAAHGQEHGQQHGHEHGIHMHGPSLSSAGGQHARRLWAAFAIVVGFFVVQFAVALATRSLALLSDAGHMATDAIGLGMALAAITLARRGSGSRHRTYGWYRLEILAALANAVLLLVAAGWVLVESLRRIGDPPDIDGAVVLGVGVLGLVANLAGFALLRSGAKESLNVEGAYLEVLADLVGSVAVVAGAGVIWATGWGWVDPVLGAAIGGWIVPRALRLGRHALRILTQAAGAHVDPHVIAAALTAVDGVDDVHDLHVWTLTSGMDVATAHLRAADGADTHRILDEASALLARRYGIEHTTLQIEPADHRGCDEVSW